MRLSRGGGGRGGPKGEFSPFYRQATLETLDFPQNNNNYVTN